MLRSQPFSSTDTVFLTGSRRSGTTWLGDTLLAGDKFCIVFEPIMAAMRQKKLPSGWRWFVGENDNWPVGTRYFEGMLTGTSIDWHALIHNSPSTIRRSKALLVKSVYGNRYVPWLSNRIQARRYVVVVRHPCAYVNSFLRMGIDTSARSIDQEPHLAQYVDAVLPGLSSKLKSWKSQEEIRAVEWAIDQHAVLGSQHQRKWSLVSYEKLIVDGKNELHRLFGELNLQVSEEVVAKFGQASFTTFASSIRNDRHASTDELLGGWRRHMSNDQISRVLEIVSEFGINGYSHEPLPNFQLAGFSD